MQVYYYRGKAARKASNEGLRNSGDSEETPLLNGNTRAQEETSIRTIILRYAAAVLFICLVGVFAWGISSTAGADGGDEAEDSPQDEKMSTELKWTVQILGWSSALLYVRLLSVLAFLLADIVSSLGHAFLKLVTLPHA